MILRLRHYFLPILIAFLPSLSLAEDQLYEVNFWNRTTVDLEKDSKFEDTETNHAELKLSYSPKNSGFKFGAEVDNFYLNNDVAKADYRTYVRFYETYYKYKYGSNDFKVGYQIVRWGKTDEISPFDVITAEDFRDGFVRPRAERKIATPMLVWNKSFENSDLQILTKPVFTADRRDFSDSDWALLGNQRGGNEPPVDVRTPDISFNQVSIGSRYSSRYRGFDYAINAFSGPNTAPTISTENLGNPGLPQGGNILKAEYLRTNFIGLELEREVMSSILRADIMLSMNEYNYDKYLNKVKSNLLKAVVGLEKNFDNEVYFNVQVGEYLKVGQYDGDSSRNLEGIFTYLNYPLIENEVKIGTRNFLSLSDFSSYLNVYSIFHDRGSWCLEAGADLMFGDFTIFNQVAGDNDQGYLVFKFRL